MTGFKENIQKLIDTDTEKLCVDEVRLGRNDFKNLLESFQIAKKWAQEFKNNDIYQTLDGDERALVHEFFDKFSKFIDAINNFHPANLDDHNKQNQRANIEQSVKTYYTKTRERMRPIISHIQGLPKAGQLAYPEYSQLLLRLTEVEKENKDMKNIIEDINRKESSNKFHEHFEGRFNDLSKMTGWRSFLSIKIFLLRVVAYLIPVFSLICGVVRMMEKNKVVETVKSVSATNINEVKKVSNVVVFNWSEVPIYLAVLVIFLLVLQHLRNATREMSILKNLRESYGHRSKVAETLPGFLGLSDNDVKLEMAKEAAIAMFQRIPSGYLTKDQIEQSHLPIQEITNFFGNKPS